MARWGLPFVALPALTLGAAACTSLLGDFSSTADTGPDGGMAGVGDGGPSSQDGASPGGDSGDTGTIAIVAPDFAIYLGQTATFTASANTSPAGSGSFVWTVAAVPAASAITSAALTSPATASPSFVPDVPGVYVLRGEVHAGTAVGTHDVRVTAAVASVFYARWEQPAAGTADAAPPGNEAFYAAGSDGNNARPVMCPTTQADTADPYQSGNAFDFWEPPAGQPYKFAAFYPVVGDGGLNQVQLVVGTSDSTCAMPPVTVGVFDDTLAGMQPRFSPDGSRVAFYNDAMQVVTIGSDGTDRHPVAGYLAFEPDGSAPSYDVGAESNSSPPRVQWTASGSLAWARSTPSGWQIVTAPDQIGAPVTVYMDCLGVTPHQIAMLSDGTVIAAYRPDGPSGAENLYRLKLDASNDCAVVHQYTTLSLSDAGEAGFATDFSVSPDEKRIAFEAVDTTSQSTAPWLDGMYPGGFVYTVPVDGSSAPSQITPDPSLNGPRWIADGTAIAYTRIDTNPYTTTQQFGNLIRLIQHPPTMSVRVLGAAGGASRVIAQGDGTSVAVTTTGNGGSCSLGTGASPGAAGLVALAGLAFAARRRKPRRAP